MKKQQQVTVLDPTPGMTFEQRLSRIREVAAQAEDDAVAEARSHFHGTLTRVVLAKAEQLAEAIVC